MATPSRTGWRLYDAKTWPAVWESLRRRAEK